MTQEKLGIYIHIPFCRSLCHYCDFAKSANFNDEHVKSYFGLLESQIKSLLASDVLKPHFNTIETIFFGGGTPGLFTTEYRPLLEPLLSSLPNIKEITIETNPEDISVEAVKIWRDLGFNRLSMGVQTFHDGGLKAMTRNHSCQGVLKALDIIPLSFNNFNLDLIYGWPHQTEAQWQQDLMQALKSEVTHLSLYNLIFESRTPLGRQSQRGAIHPLDDDILANMYQTACEVLEKKAWNHEEVSNWSKDNASCQHNWLYWQNQSFIGLGCGAFGLWNFESEFGMRYSFPREFRSYLKTPIPKEWNSFESFVKQSSGTIELRNSDNWMMEYIGGALRSEDGVDLNKVEEHCRKIWNPTYNIKEGLQQNLLFLADGQLKLTKPEWFRENQWALETVMSFK